MSQAPFAGPCGSTPMVLSQAPSAGSSRRGVLAALAAAWGAPAAVMTGSMAMSGGVAAAGATTTLPVRISSGLPTLRRGLNLSHWFEYRRIQSVTAGELRGLRDVGFDHVRLPFDPLACGWSPAAPELLPFRADLLAALNMIIQAGLDVVLDLHLTPEFKVQVETTWGLESALVTLWSGLARACAGLPTARLAFELFNEPAYYGDLAPRWPVLLQRLLAAVRAQAPQHLVLVSGNEGGGVDALVALTPLNDARLAYVFHCYDPFVFTHQGITWLDERYTSAGLRTGVRYPASAQRGVVPTVTHHTEAGALEWAAHERAAWDSTPMQRLIDRAGNWALAQGVRVVCNEFGVIRAQVDTVSRYRWLQDMRRALEADDIGWTVWDYTDLFGLTLQSTLPGYAGARSFDPMALSALGLRP